MSIPRAWRAARARSRSWCGPLHDHVITATLNVPPNAKALREAQHHLESVLLGVERQFPPTPAGMGIAVAWGLPYFSQYIPRLGKASEFFKAGTPYPRYLPIDVSTSKTEGRTVYAVQEARTFPSDQPPPGFGPVRLEQNHVAVLLRSDSLANITAATQALFGPGSNQAGSLFNVTSIRRGFAGGGFYGGQQSLPSKMALAAHIPGAQSIPRHAQAFLGFDTTLVSNLGPDVIANLETLPGLTDQWPNGYFKQGTTMHLSHLYEDLATWYEQNFPQYEQRANAMLYPGQSPTPAPGTLALQPPGQTEAQVAQGVQKYHSYGHTGSLSVVDSTASQITSHYGEVYPAGTTIPVRGDFNTLDNPFYYTSDPSGRPLQQAASGRVALPYIPADDCDLQSRPALDGRILSRCDTPCRPALPPRRHQLGPAYDPPAELSGSTTSPSLLPARRVPCLTPPAPAAAQSDRKGRAEEVNLASSRRWPVPRITVRVSQVCAGPTPICSGIAVREVTVSDRARAAAGVTLAVT